MKKLILLLAIAFAAPAMAQTCSDFVQFKNGTTYTSTTYTGADKVTGSATTTVSNVGKTASGLKADLSQVVKDDKGKETGTMTSTVLCDGGVFSIDMKSFAGGQLLKTHKDMEMTFDGNTLTYPASLAAGQSLPDGMLKMTTTNSGTKMSETNINITDRKVLAKESMTTTAGTFECYKISYTMNISTVMYMPNGSVMNLPGGSKPRQITEWFNFKVGPVRSESWRDGKMDSYTLLTELKQ